MKLLTAEQVADKLQVHIKWVYKNRDLPRVEFGGHVRWNEEDVENFLRMKTSRKSNPVMRRKLNVVEMKRQAGKDVDSCG